MFQYKVISPNLKPVYGTRLPRHPGVIVLFTKDNEKGENMRKKPRDKIQLERRSEE